MAMSRYAIVGLLITGFVIGANLVSVQKAAAFFVPACFNPKTKKWLPEGAPCGPKNLGGKCHAEGQGQAKACK
jgi:hypothetical protein